MPKKKGQRWTEKKIREKIKDIESAINYQRRAIERSEAEIADLEILIQHYRELLAKKFNNPSSKKFGGEDRV